MASDFIATINEQVARIARATVRLPESKMQDKGDMPEGDYNDLAANSNTTDYRLMDRHNVVITGRTSPIEVCDILTLQRQLICVKRKFSSATLSHLFSQGETAGTLLVDSAEFRKAVREKLQEEPPAFAKLFDDQTFRAADFEIVHAIIADWQGDKLVDRLPFFSKVNLVNRLRHLRRIGYSVTYAPIGIAPRMPASRTSRGRK